MKSISFPSQLLIAIVSLGFMLIYSGQLVIVAIGITLVITLSTIALLPILRQRIRRLLALESENQGLLVETFKGALTLKATSATPQLWQELQMRFGRLSHLTFRTIQLNLANRTFSGLISGIGSILLLGMGGQLVIDRQLTTGQLLAFNTMHENFLAFTLFTVRFVNDAMRVNVATQRLAEVMDATPEVSTPVQKAWATIPADAEIVCQHLHFHYPGRLDLLTDFSVVIPGGQTTAIIGPSGCGKSSLAKLIAGLYPLDSGNIRFDIYNSQDLALDCWRQQVILVPQEPHFWSRSILENFRLGVPDVTFEQIVRSCQMMGADNFISQLPDKYHTVLGEFGANLSGGQRQRLAIARAMVANPAILILDESTVNLDPSSEAQVLDRVLKQRDGKTTLLISHRPQVIGLADSIVLLDQGQIMLQGTLQELRHQPGQHSDFVYSK